MDIAPPFLANVQAPLYPVQKRGIRDHNRAETTKRLGFSALLEPEWLLKVMPTHTRSGLTEHHGEMLSVIAIDIGLLWR